MGSTRKRRVPPKAKRVDWKAAYAALEANHQVLKKSLSDALDENGSLSVTARNAARSNEELAGQVNGVRDELRACLPSSRTERYHDVVELAKMASATVQHAQQVTSGAARAMRAAGYAASTVEEVAKVIGGAIFLRPGQTVVSEHQVRNIKGMLDDLLKDGDD